VVFYMTTTASTLKLKADISRVTQVLQAHGVAFEEVDLSLVPERREEMTAVSGSRVLPQLHVDGKYLGDTEAVLELNDEGELLKLLRG
jgi:glutaredoxin-related protein